MKTRTVALAAVLIIVIIVAGVYAYFTLPASVTLLMKDPPIQAYPSTVSNIWINFTSIQMHQIRSGGDSWINLTSKSTVTVDLMAILTTTKSLGAFSIPAGNYTEMRFSVIAAWAKIANVNVTLALTNSPNSLKIPIPGQLNIAANQSATITVDVRADNASLLQGKLLVTMTASVS